MKTPREKYNSDHQFKGLVDMMVGYITECNYTPSEMREAALMASILYEEHNYRRIIYVDREVEEAFMVLDKKSNLPLWPPEKP